MMTMCYSKDQQLKLLSREIAPIPDYRFELHQQGSLPKGVDKKCRLTAALRLSFEQESALREMYEVKESGVLAFKQRHFGKTLYLICRQISHTSGLRNLVVLTKTTGPIHTGDMIDKI
jgi:hypothetical protein